MGERLLRSRIQAKRLGAVTCVIVLCWLGATVVHAQDATWVGGNGVDPNEWTEPNNWTPTTVPSGTATFTNTANTTTADNDNGVAVIGAVNFTLTALAYTINVDNPFIINGAGVTNSSTNTQTINIGSGMSLVFQNSSTANNGTGAVTYDNNGTPNNPGGGGFIYFQNTSNAGNANTTYTNNEIIQFNDSSSAGSASIVNNVETDFFNSSTAGAAHITNAATGTLTFNNNATAGAAIIGNSGNLQFSNSSSGGTAAITNSGAGATITFNDTSTASGATINTTNTGVIVTFNDSSSGGNATFTSNPGTGVTYTFNNTSTAGAANFQLVDVNLTFNNSSTADSAIITMPTVTHPGNITFNDTSSAGNANITNVAVAALSTSVQFLDASTAGNAIITNNPNSSVPNEGGILNFGTLGGTDTANAGTATIINNQFGSTSFFANTSASSATITNNSGGNTNFQDQSTAANAIIINNNGGTTSFGVPIVGTDTSTAGSASITNNSGGATDFNALTTAGNAVITTLSGGSVTFTANSTGGNAQFITNGTGFVDFSGTTGPAGNKQISAGSIAGSGNYFLGANALTVGGNNLSTTVSGVISDGGLSGGTGASLFKAGTGALTLSGANTYTGGTTISAGAIVVGNNSALGTGPVAMTAGSTLSFLNTGNFTIANNFTISGDPFFTPPAGTTQTISGTLSNAAPPAPAGIVDMTGAGTLVLSGTNTYSGGTIISSGTVQVTNNSSVGTGTVTLNGGTFQSGAAGLSFSNAFAINTTNGTLDTQANTLTLSGAIANGNGPGALTKAGSGTLILSGTSSYTGGTNVNAGTLQAGATNAFASSSAFTVVSGATLSLNSFNETVGSLAGAGNVTLGSGTLTTGGNDSSTTFSGSIGSIGGSGGLTKAGNGAFILTGASTYGGGTTISAGTLQIGNGGTSGSITGNVTDNGVLAFDRSDAITFGGTISGSGALAQNGGIASNVVLTGNNTYTGGTTISAGTLQIGNGGTSGSITGNVADNGVLAFDRSDAITFSGLISGTGSVQQNGGIASNVVLTGNNTYTGGTTISAGTLQIGNGGTSGSITGNVTDNGVLAFDRSDAITFGGLISGTGSVQQIGSGTLTLPNANTYSGGTILTGGTIAVGNDNSLGSGAVGLVDGATLQFLQSGLVLPNAISLGVAAGTIDTGAHTDTLAGVISGPDDLTKIGTGTLILSATNTYRGPTNVNAGTLDVTGSIAHSSLTTVANGAALIGSGTVGNAQINSGGTLAPGASGSPSTSLTIAGNLAFASGAIYLVQVNPSSTTSAKVSGTATLTGATVNAQFASGSYVAKQYDILHAGGLNGTVFASLGTANLLAGFTASLSYTATDAFLDLTATLGKSPSLLPTGGLTINERNVANALNNFFNSGGTLPPNFLPVFGLTGGSLATTLMHLDGEVAVDGEFATFQLMDEFLQLMLDPFVDGRLGSGAGIGGGKAMGFAPDQQAFLPSDIALAYAGVLKAPPAPPFVQRWTAWGASYGGANSTTGDPAIVGSSNVTAQTFGFAAGMDYHYSPDTIFGFALGGGGTNWGLAGGMGTGRSDAFQAGVYGITRAGPAYLAAALAFANHWMTTDRSTMGDALSANFSAQSYGVRVETGYRFAVLPALGVTPYAAVQAQDFHTPNYSETDLTGGGFGLSYAAMNATDTRTELGARFDDPTVVGGVPLVLRARVAWAHDFVSNPSLSAVFESLPGANFVVNGAPIPQNSALTSAGAEFFITPRVTFLAKFDGEFAPGSQTYAGSGTLRYSW
jgi:autotransporter-associated beta strand protein